LELRDSEGPKLYDFHCRVAKTPVSLAGCGDTSWLNPGKSDLPSPRALFILTGPHPMRKLMLHPTCQNHYDILLLAIKQPTRCSLRLRGRNSNIHSQLLHPYETVARLDWESSRPHRETASPSAGGLIASLKPRESPKVHPSAGAALFGWGNQARCCDQSASHNQKILSRLGFGIISSLIGEIVSYLCTGSLHGSHDYNQRDYGQQQVSVQVCPCVNAKERQSLVGTFMASHALVNQSLYVRFGITLTIHKNIIVLY